MAMENQIKARKISMRKEAYASSGETATLPKSWEKLLLNMMTHLKTYLFIAVLNFQIVKMQECHNLRK